MITRGSSKKAPADNTDTQDSPVNKPDRDTESDEDVDLDLLPKDKDQVIKTEDLDKSSVLVKVSSSNIMSREKPPHQEDADHYTSMNFMIKMPQLVSNSIVPLNETGSNYLAWKNDLSVIIDALTKIDDYLDEERKTIPGDHQIVMLIRLSVCSELRIQIDTKKSAFEVFNVLKSMFHFPSRSTHINLWKDILQAQIDSPSEVPNHINKIKSKIEELQRTGFEFTKDSFLSVAMQLGLSASFAGVSSILDNRLRNDPDKRITARETEEAIRAETHRLTSSAPDLLLDVVESCDFSGMELNHNVVIDLTNHSNVEDVPLGQVSHSHSSSDTPSYIPSRLSPPIFSDIPCFAQYWKDYPK